MSGETFTLFVVSVDHRQFPIVIDKDATIDELHKKVLEKIEGVTENDVRLHFAGKDILPQRLSGRELVLTDYNFNDGSNIFAVMRPTSGSDDPPPSFEPKVYGPDVQLKVYGPDVQLTDKPDMFTLNDDEGGQRAEMPCGHAISPESLTAYCRSLLTAGKYEFLCPYKAKPEDPYCDTIWDLFVVTKLAVLTADEVKEFEKKIAENYLQKAVGIQSCPSCKGFCERKNKTDQRVRCLVCKTDSGRRYEFCWFCLKTWLTNGFTDCGNFGCTGEDPRLRVIKGCTKKKVVEVLCPAIRACPSCGLLIEHKEACKQMICQCGQKFCFICLKKASSSGTYQCGTWNFKCEPAPVQTIIPGV